MAVAEIHDTERDLYAISEGTIVLFTPEQFQAMQIMPDNDLEAMMAAIA